MASHGSTLSHHTDDIIISRSASDSHWRSSCSSIPMSLPPAYDSCMAILNKSNLLDHQWVEFRRSLLQGGDGHISNHINEAEKEEEEEEEEDDA